MELAQGTAITDEVTLLRPLDEGGMGSVWIGRHSGLGRDVAVKFITEELRKDEPTSLDRFRREAAVLRQVDSDHIVESYGQGTAADGTPYIVMELLSGKNLVEFMEERGSPLHVEDVASLARQLAEALTQFHQFDIVHRDLKGENVIVVSSDPLTIKIIDFGCAKIPDLPGGAALTAPGMLVGSADYMSPEQIVNAALVDHQADLWGMGVLLYAALVFELPFRGKELADLFTAIHRGDYAPPTRLRPELPAAVDDFFARAFHPKRAERFLSAAEMADTLVASLDGTAAPRANLTPAVLVSAGALALLTIVVMLIAC